MAMPAIHVIPASPINGIRERLSIMKANRQRAAFIRKIRSFSRVLCAQELFEMELEQSGYNGDYAPSYSRKDILKAKEISGKYGSLSRNDIEAMVHAMRGCRLSADAAVQALGFARAVAAMPVPLTAKEERKLRMGFFTDLADFMKADARERWAGYCGLGSISRYQKKTAEIASAIAEKYGHLKGSDVAAMAEKCARQLTRQFRLAAKATFITGLGMAASAFVPSAFSEPLGIAALVLGVVGMFIATQAILYVGEKAAKCVPEGNDAESNFKSALSRAAIA